MTASATISESSEHSERVPARPNTTIHSLQGMRAVAALLVVIDHALLKLTDNDPAGAMTHFAWTLGSTGVYIFFVISGFIMVHVSWDNFGKPGASGSFLRRRIIRIVPLYWLGTFLGLGFHKVAGTHGIQDGWYQLACSLSFIPYISEDGQWYPILPGGWTLNFEMLFYVVFGICLCLPRRLALPATGLFFLAFIAIGPWLGNESIAFLASPVILWFILGMAFATLWRHRGGQEASWLARLAKPLEPFGDASYSLYLSHGFVLTMVLRTWTKFVGAPSLWFVPVSMVIATIVGFAVHRAVERPTLQMINSLWKSSRPRQPGLRVQDAR
jgi:exopolysaccharide production protein ExoZ